MCVAAALAAPAATFTWQVPAGGTWDAAGQWACDDPARSNSWPDAIGDTARIPALHQTNCPGTISIWPNQAAGHFTTTLGALHLLATNALWLGTTVEQPNTLVFATTGGAARLVFTNTLAAPAAYWQHLLALRFATRYLLSNDLYLTTVSLPDADGHADYAAVWLADQGAFSGPGALIKEGAGRLIIGGHYADVPRYAAPRIALDSLCVNDGVLDIAHSATLTAPVWLNGAQRAGGTSQYAMGAVRQFSRDGMHADLVFNGGAYYANYLDVPRLTNAGNLLVLAPSFLLVSDYGAGGAGAQPRHAVFSGALRGTNVLCLPWGGTVQFTGVIAPGVSSNAFSIGALFLTSAAPQRVTLGSSATPVAVQIDLAGAGGVPGVDHDILVLEGGNDVALDALDLTVSTALEHSATTNVIVYTDGVVSGALHGVVWRPAGATGTVLYYENAIAITAVLIPEPGTLLVSVLACCVIGTRQTTRG
jgi:hypothetical protein